MTRVRIRRSGAPTKKGQPLDLVWTDSAGVERNKRMYDEPQALREAGKIEQQLARGENTDPRAGRQTFRAVAEDWLATKIKARPDTRAQYKRQLTMHAFPAFGSRRIAPDRLGHGC